VKLYHDGKNINYGEGFFMIKNLWVTGYRSFELGIFKDNDPKAKVIQDFFEQRITNYVEDGTEWVLTGAQLGVEQIVGKAVQEIKKKAIILDMQ
jgi:Uncharacterized protein conserved in bacteria